MKNPRDALEVIAAVLLGLVSVATALGAYQSAVWASQAADYALVSQQLRDRNLSESLTTQLIFRDDSGKVYDLLALDTEELFYPERADRIALDREVLLLSSSPEFATAWERWVDAGQPDDLFPVTNADYEAALFADPQSMQYGSYVADLAAEAIEAKSLQVAVASVIFAIALFLLGVAGVNGSWRVAAALVGIAALAFTAGTIVVLVAIV